MLLTPLLKKVCQEVCSVCPSMRERGPKGTNCTALCNLDTAMHILVPFISGLTVDEATKYAMERRHNAEVELRRVYDEKYSHENRW